MPVIKTARYRVQPDASEEVERAMRDFAAHVGAELSDTTWTTYREREDPTRYLSVITARDEAADERHQRSPGTERFVEALYPNLDGEVTFTEHELVADSGGARLDLRSAETSAFDGTEQHARLARLEGSWSGVAKTWLDPSKPPEEQPFEGHIALVLGGRFARLAYGSRLMGRAFSGELTIAYESGDRRWATAWIDSFHTSPAIMRSEGERDDVERIRARGTFFAGDGPRWGWVTEIDDARAEHGELRILMSNVTPDGEEMPGIEIALTRG